METEALTVDREEAIRMWRKYQSHKHYQTPYDAEIARIYKAISQGKVLIRALGSIVKAGVGPDGLPKLAIVRADAKQCFLQMSRDGSARMSDLRWINGRTAKDRYIDFPSGSFVGRFDLHDHSAIAPIIPPDIRPQRGIENYHVLFEALWRREPPKDPLLLRRYGKGDIWLVCGAWELTEVERGVMADHLALQRRH